MPDLDDWRQAHDALQSSHADLLDRFERHRRLFLLVIVLGAVAALVGAIEISEAFHQAFLLQ